MKTTTRCIVPMILTELEAGLESLRGKLQPTDAQSVDGLLRILSSWRFDAKTPDALMNSLDRSLGHIWFTTDDIHKAVCALLEKFRPAVESLVGMTMNERLLVFDLVGRWDGSVDAERLAIRDKLEAFTT